MSDLVRDYAAFLAEKAIDLLARVVYGAFAGLAFVFVLAQDIVRELRR